MEKGKNKDFERLVNHFCVISPLHITEAACIAKAKAINDLIEKMRINAVRFHYKKNDGTLVEAYGKLKGMEDYINTFNTCDDFTMLYFYDLLTKKVQGFKKENLVVEVKVKMW